MEKNLVEYEVETRISNKSGKKYTVLVLKFPNGYDLTHFLNAEQEYIIRLNMSNNNK